MIQIGETISGAITSSDAACRLDMTVEGGWDGLCNAFNVTAPSDGNSRNHGSVGDRRSARDVLQDGSRRTDSICSVVARRWWGKCRLKPARRL